MIHWYAGIMVENLQQALDAPLPDADARTADKVAQAQAILRNLGFEIAEEERTKKILGETTLKAMDDLRKLGDTNPLAKMVVTKLMKTLFGVDLDEVCGPDSEGPGRSGGGGSGSQHYIHSAGRHLDRSQLQAIAAVTPGTGLDGVARLAAAYDGVHEEGDNQGPAVQLFCGTTGVPWCGGFAHYVLEQKLPGVYTQSNFLLARSFMEEGDKYGAFHRDGAPHKGDVVVFQRGSGGSGHVGIVTDVAADGTVTYAAGNTCDQVMAAKFNWHQPPADLLGHTDSKELAIAKGKGSLVANVQESQQTTPAPIMQARVHNAGDFARG
jgi:hypothetical protein